MELQQLRYVIAVAEEQNFTRAAARCHVVQSALSHQIKALEREIGVDLFARTSRRVELTAAGHAFLERARESVGFAERAIEEANAASGVVQGTVTVGMIPTVTAIDVPRALGELRAAHPLVQVRLQVGDSRDFIAQLADGRMDIAILGLSDRITPAKVATRVLAEEQLVAVVGSEHRFTERRTLRLRDLADETFADFPAGTSGRAQSDLAFADAGVTRRVMFDSMSPQMTLDLVRQNLAVALLSPGTVPTDPSLVSIPVVDGPRRIEYLAWSEFNPSPAAKALLALLA